VLTESAAILMHLGLAFPNSGLLSEDPAERDVALRGLVYIPANCYSCISILDYPGRYTTATDDAAHEAIRAGTRERLHRHWDIFADLHPAPADGFYGGTQPGALDLLAAVVSKWSGAGCRSDLHPAPADGFYGGTQPGALDLLAAVVSKWSGARKHVKASRPAFSALLERVDSHPAVALVFGRHWQTAAQLPTGA
jgi:GST-like protein